MPIVSDTYRNPNEVSVPPRQRTPIISYWLPPLEDIIKINMDGSFCADLNRCGIGGLFQDHSGNTLLHFAKQVNTNSAILTEIHAIRKGLLIAAASCWSSSSQFLFESNSANAVTWFNDPKIASWKFKNIIKKSILCFGCHIVCYIAHIHHVGNEVADVLARMRFHGVSFIEFV